MRMIPAQVPMKLTVEGRLQKADMALVQQGTFAMLTVPIVVSVPMGLALVPALMVTTAKHVVCSLL